MNTAPPFPPPVDHWRRRRNYQHALTGQLPAEALTNQGDREQLIHTLWTAGWTDLQIAVHTRWTNHTVQRIRDRLELSPNRHDANEIGVA